MSVTATTGDEEALYRAFVGPRGQDYYLAYFARAQARGYAPIAWHWPVLFFGLLWFLFRRMHLWALIVFAVPHVAGALGAIAETYAPGSGRLLALALILGFLVWLALNANAIYYRHARATVAAARARFPGNREAQLAALHAAGGVNPQSPVIFVVIVLLVSTLLQSLVATAG